ncbi:TadE/TadG family type IV pilus assembly protein [Ferrimonas pelagia]|uniref:TadE-like domain-containing protein n=1 Tax=Ferrimonas pelagia TaxID=1177826 RepID=A0ABP9EN60_9GAMM
MKTVPGSMKRQRGVAAVEATIALPIVFFLFLATAEFGRLIYQYNQVNSLARDACRYLISNTRLGSNDQVEISDSVALATKRLAVFGNVTSGTPLMPGMTIDDVTVALVSDELVTVSVTYDWTPIFGSSLNTFFGNSLDLTWDLTATLSMRPL